MDSRPSPAAELRGKAEQHLRSKAKEPAEPLKEADVRALVHELEVHQIELEMQNEELQRARAAAEEASEKYYDLFDFAPVGYFLWDHEGRILEVNLAGAALLGLNRNQVVQKRFGQFVAAEDRDRFAEFCKRALVTDAMQTCEVKMPRDGRTVYLLVEGIAAHGRQGHEPLCSAAVIDVTQQKRADELAAANRALVAQIAARKQAEEALLQAKDAAEIANEAKSRFLANISHELRTPMNAILGMIELALQQALSPATKDFLQTAKESADLLLVLLNDLLDTAKIEAGKLELELAPFSPRRMLDHVTRALAVRASEKELRFRCRIPDDLPAALIGDERRLREVLFNLAGNAIKFTARGEIEVGVHVRRSPRAGEGTVELGICRPGHGDRHIAIRPGTHLPAVLAGRCVDNPPLRRHRLGFDDFRQPRVDDGWANLGGERAGTGQHVLLRRSFALGGGTASRTGNVCSAFPPRHFPDCGFFWPRITPRTRNWPTTFCKSAATRSKSQATGSRRFAWSRRTIMT